MRKNTDMPAYNKQLRAMAGVTPQKVLYKLAMYQPASIFVYPATARSRRPVVCYPESVADNTRKKRAL